MKTLQQEYEGAGTLHGHYCGGLAVGVRAAWEAEELLHGGEISCYAERSACWIDGIRWVLGAEKENGRLTVGDGTEARFLFSKGEDCVELKLKKLPPMEKEQMINFCMTAPRESIFEVDFP